MTSPPRKDSKTRKPGKRMLPQDDSFRLQVRRHAVPRWQQHHTTLDPITTLSVSGIHQGLLAAVVEELLLRQQYDKCLEATCILLRIHPHNDRWLAVYEKLWKTAEPFMEMVLQTEHIPQRQHARMLGRIAQKQATGFPFVDKYGEGILEIAFVYLMHGNLDSAYGTLENLSKDLVFKQDPLIQLMNGLIKHSTWCKYAMEDLRKEGLLVTDVAALDRASQAHGSSREDYNDEDQDDRDDDGGGRGSQPRKNRRVEEGGGGGEAIVALEGGFDSRFVTEERIAALGLAKWIGPGRHSRIALEQGQLEAELSTYQRRLRAHEKRRRKAGRQAGGGYGEEEEGSEEDNDDELGGGLAGSGSGFSVPYQADLNKDLFIFRLDPAAVMGSYCVPMARRTWEEFELAVSHLRAAVLLDPTSDAALLPLLQLHLASGDVNMALLLLTEACQKMAGQGVSAAAGLASPAAILKQCPSRTKTGSDVFTMLAVVLEAVKPRDVEALKQCYLWMIANNPVSDHALSGLFQLAEDDGVCSAAELLEPLALRLDIDSRSLATWQRLAQSLLQVQQELSSAGKVSDDAAGPNPSDGTRAEAGDEVQVREGGEDLECAAAGGSGQEKGREKNKGAEEMLWDMWRPRKRWWRRERFDREEVDTCFSSEEGRLLAVSKASCAVHLLGRKNSFTGAVFRRLERDQDIHLLSLLAVHRRVSKAFALASCLGGRSSEPEGVWMEEEERQLGEEGGGDGRPIVWMVPGCGRIDYEALTSSSCMLDLDT